MKELALTLSLVSISFLLPVNQLLFTKANWMQPQGGKPTQIGHTSRYHMAQRRQRKTFRNNYNSSKVTKKLYYSLTRTRQGAERRNKWLLSYRQGQLKLLIWQTRIKMRVMHYKPEIRKQLEKQYGMRRLTDRMESLRANHY